MKRNIAVLITILISFSTVAPGLVPFVDKAGHIMSGDFSKDVKVPVPSTGEQTGLISGEVSSSDVAKSNSKPIESAASGTGMTLTALKGPSITDLNITFDNSALTLADRVKVDTYYIDGSKKYTENYRDVPIVESRIILPLSSLNRSEKIDVMVTIGSGKSRTDITGNTTVLLRPDITIQNINAPLTALQDDYFNVQITALELNNDTGASFNLVVQENGTVLSSNITQVTGGSSVMVTIPLLISQTGLHHLSAIISDSDPAEYSGSNNVQDFSVDILEPRPVINPANYSTRYYSQDDEYKNNKNLNSASEGGTHIEVSEYFDKKVSERFNYILTLNQETIFPVDRLYIQVLSDSMVVEEHDIININITSMENGKAISRIYYPGTGSTITITSGTGSTEVKLERSSMYHEMVSSGYNYYSPTDNTSWNTSSTNQSGIMMSPNVNLTVYSEFIDNGVGYGGTETLILTPPEYLNSSWNEGGVSGYRNIITYYTRETGVTTVEN